jgi:release factor glutamine methyltransferase
VTVGEAIRAAAERLADVTDTGRLDAELLMAHALVCNRSDVLLRHLAGAVPHGFDALVDRRLAHEPVAYITGCQDFFGLQFAVAPGVLIPRSDSETLVNVAIEACAMLPEAPARVLDCGVGPGTLLLAVLAQWPEAHGVGIDRSSAALEIARCNAEAFGLAARTALLHRDWTSPGWTEGLGQFDLILANPPYVETGAVLDPQVRAWEPAGALFAGADGLDDYRLLIPCLPGLLAPGGHAVVEIGSTQAAPVAALAAAAGLSSVLHHDLGGRPRALSLRNLPWQTGQE